MITQKELKISDFFHFSDESFYSITSLLIKVLASNVKYMFLIINHIMCDKVPNSSTKIIRITPLELRIFMK
jgi:hypothetical protein